MGWGGPVLHGEFETRVPLQISLVELLKTTASAKPGLHPWLLGPKLQTEKAKAERSSAR
jgi:hypothetical protein